MRINEILRIIYIDILPSYDRVKHLIEISKGSAAQRTAEWYSRRNSCITASAVHDILKSNANSSINKFVQEKCGRNFFFTNKYVEWGNKYEDIAVAIFERMYDVEVFDAPLLLHEVFPFLGASCDGFVLDHKNKKGFLIEIKCPYSREPNGVIPDHYYEQPQMQSCVTYVDKCAFFDCKLSQYKTTSEMVNDNSAICMGFIINYTVFNEDGTCSNKYWNHRDNIIFKQSANYTADNVKELEMSTLEMFNEEMKKNNVNYYFEDIHGWKLVNFIRDDQKLDKSWLPDNFTKMNYIWKMIEHYKQFDISILDAAINYCAARKEPLKIIEYDVLKDLVVIQSENYPTREKT